jgi:hypothetical protein
MGERKIKGSMLVDFVRMIRANKDKNWNEYLKPEDWEVINQRILPSVWYPVEVFMRCGWAVFKVIAQGNLDIARMGGRMQGKNLFENVYKGLVANQDPQTAVNRFVVVYNQFFNFSSLRFEEVDKNHVKVHNDYDESHNHPGMVPYCHNLMGILETLIEKSGGKNVKIELKAKQWEGARTTVMDVTWE